MFDYWIYLSFSGMFHDNWNQITRHHICFFVWRNPNNGFYHKIYYQTPIFNRYYLFCATLFPILSLKSNDRGWIGPDMNEGFWAISLWKYCCVWMLTVMNVCPFGDFSMFLFNVLSLSHSCCCCFCVCFL